MLGAIRQLFCRLTGHWRRVVGKVEENCLEKNEIKTDLRVILIQVYQIYPWLDCIFYFIKNILKNKIVTNQVTLTLLGSRRGGFSTI